MRLFIVALLIFFQISIYGQSYIPGKFNTAWAIDNSFYHHSTLTLNCDKTYILADSGMIALGNWEVKKKKLILHIDSVITKLSINQTYKRQLIKLTIIDGKLFPKLISRRAYNKIPELLEKQTGEAQKFESYGEFRKRNKKNYYRRNISFNCTTSS